ncbi:MAG: acetyltransferase [Phycisphaeraceae bacterium]|nr:MAG: acetyltransferase [Phycisphaeraceae bacterium]
MHERSGLLFVGGGGHAVVVAEAAQILCSQTGLAPVGCLDDADEPQLSTPPGAVPRLGPISSLAEHAGAHLSWIMALGDLALRRRILDALPDTLSLGSAWTVTHPTASVARSAQVGRGVFVGPMAVVHARARVGNHAIVNSGAIIEHGVQVGANAHIAPGSVIGGDAGVGADTLIGMGAMVLPRVKIGTGCVIGAGAVVRADVADGATVVGVPGRAIG